MRILTLRLIMLGTLVWPSMGLADIAFNSGTWNTSFDYGQACSMESSSSGVGDRPGTASCQLLSTDAIKWSDSTPLPHDNNGEYTEAIVAANNTRGDGGMGHRSWIGPSKAGTTQLQIDFPTPESEFWIRWYQRYEKGFSWPGGGNPNNDKCFDMWASGPGSRDLRIIPEHANGRFQIFVLHTSAPDIPSSPSITWNDVFGTTSDGLFHMFEVYIKVNSATGVSDGIGRQWIDGVLVSEATNFNFTGGSPDEAKALQGISHMRWHENQGDTANARPFYVDYDDIEIWNTTPPSTSPDGDPWIGPLKGFSGANQAVR